MAELLAPAGNKEALDAAIGEGADAVYLGLKSFNARLRSSNFAWNQFEAAVGAVHKLGKKIFVTVNTVIEEKEMERMYRFLSYLNKIGPDGLIVQDFGVVQMVQQYFPSLRLHASTQMNIASAKAANTMSRSGIRRVVLARELGLEEVREIHDRTNVELEVFVHGALCVCESGLCLFSSYLGGKSANRGLCAQACRRLYTAETNGGKKEGYFFSPHDLQLIDKIPELIQAGVHSFKIEGRMKSAEYVGSVVAAYRYVMDHWQEDPEGAISAAKRMLSTDFARAKTRYWYDSSSAENVLNPEQAGGTGIYLGTIERQKMETVTTPEGEETAVYATLQGGTYEPDIGDSIRLHRSDDSGRESWKIKGVRQISGKTWISIPPGFSAGDAVYLLQTKSMSKRYPHVLPPDIGRFRSQPGAEKLPVPDFFQPDKATEEDFPEGIYVQVSTVADMHAVLTQKPIRIILELNSETIKSLVEKKETLPFAKKEVIISLDPYVPQEKEDRLSDTIDYLISEGFWHWIVNNPAHLSMLRGKKVRLIAGPYLYAFNRWAVTWLGNQGITSIITPLENSRDNLENTFPKGRRTQVFTTVFAYPALFRMRFKLPENYDFHYFSDRQETVFKALSTEDGSYVLPDSPFSLSDRAMKIQEDGFTHLIIDFSKTSVQKNDFRRIMEAFNKGKQLPETTRFNWRDGFYSPEEMEARFEAAERGTRARPESVGLRRPGPKDRYARPGMSRRQGVRKPRK